MPEDSRENELKFYWGMPGNESHNPPGSCLVYLNRVSSYLGTRLDFPSTHVSSHLK